MNGVRLPLHGKFTPAIVVAFPRRCCRHFATGNITGNRGENRGRVSEERVVLGCTHPPWRTPGLVAGARHEPQSGHHVLTLEFDHGGVRESHDLIQPPAVVGFGQL
jgi:hypothetical protein